MEEFSICLFRQNVTATVYIFNPNTSMSVVCKFGSVDSLNTSTSAQMYRMKFDLPNFVRVLNMASNL